eukprot:TRINITY_DN10776_c0_g1_i1.p1 TRINITY_DN10776_c0_g1~~TRINITY_DN10776_c0_g1_i1.p1  ORF type:complete len:127 (-),score=4.78 TRINITY_DN10776_c0_g1_i1:234-614(-)
MVTSSECSKATPTMLSRVFVGHTKGVQSVQFSPHDPDEILTGSRDETVRLWRKSDGALIRVFVGHTKGVQSVQFSPHDPDEILTGSYDSTVRLWRKSDGALIRVFEGHTGSARTRSSSAPTTRTRS